MYMFCSFAACACNRTVGSDTFKDPSGLHIHCGHMWLHNVSQSIIILHILCTILLTDACIRSRFLPVFARNRIQSNIIKSHRTNPNIYSNYQIKAKLTGSCRMVCQAFSCKSSWLLGDNPPAPRWTFSGVIGPDSNQANQVVWCFLMSIEW